MPHTNDADAGAGVPAPLIGGEADDLPPQLIRFADPTVASDDLSVLASASFKTGTRLHVLMYFPLLLLGVVGATWLMPASHDKLPNERSRGMSEPKDAFQVSIRAPPVDREAEGTAGPPDILRSTAIKVDAFARRTEAKSGLPEPLSSAAPETDEVFVRRAPVVAALQRVVEEAKAATEAVTSGMLPDEVTSPHRTLRRPSSVSSLKDEDLGLHPPESVA